MKPPQSFLSRRLFLLTAAGAASSMGACASTDTAFVHKPLPASSPPVKMQRLLLWLTPNDERLDGAGVAARFESALAPYGVVVETGRSTKLEVDRSGDQKSIIDKFNPTYRFEIDLGEGRTASQGSTVIGTSFLVRGMLYRGNSRTPLERFYYQARAKSIPRFVDQIVEKLKAGGYL